MRPVKFKESNRTLTRPSDMPEKECDSLPATPWELKEFYEYLLRKGMSTERAWARVKIILTYYPQLSWSSDSDKQMELF